MKIILVVIPGEEKIASLLCVTNILLTCSHIHSKYTLKVQATTFCLPKNGERSFMTGKILKVNVTFKISLWLRLQGKNENRN